MKTLQILHIGALVPPKVIWMRVNRVLAWALIVSPLAQIALGTPLMRGLALDLAILLAHAALSLALFGMPNNAARRFSVALHVFGQQPEDMSPRNQYLLSGHRVGLTLLFVLLILAARPLTGLPGFFIFVGPAILLLMLACWPLVRMPLTLFQHLYPSIVQALRRWGMRRHADDVAAVIVGLFVLLSSINLIR
ncbi:hypothetical protein INH39_07750 [Massilia violaceinigra]|uniref:Uncharacterized protein n=1 Tax=Massilia violaceinigra TaxID=2045208 RepID=A0ABY4ADB6_9BURK|nr:hypothetical protein [Massilia violaceinigra]UOD31571.1 hypothetical protein INH39_07750 [Massilia violaceinigra]